MKSRNRNLDININNSIECPHCRKNINLTQVVQTQMKTIIEKLSQENINTDIAAAIAEEKRRNEKKQIEIINHLKEDIEAKTQLVVLEKNRVDALNKERKKLIREQFIKNQEYEDKLAIIQKENNLAYQKAVKAARKEGQATAVAESEKKNKELEYQLAQTKKALKETELRLNQGSQQVQGEVLQRDIYEILCNTFPNDTIDMVSKGVNGADIIQTINNKNFDERAKIIWEAKNTKKFMQKWVQKLGDDMRKANAIFGIIVFNRTNGEVHEPEFLDKNILLIHPQHIGIVSLLLHTLVVRVSINKKFIEDRESKKDEIYDYIRSDRLAGLMESLLKNIFEMHKELMFEQKQNQVFLKRREKNIKNLIHGLLEFSGDVEAVLGDEIISSSNIKGLKEIESGL